MSFLLGFPIFRGYVKLWGVKVYKPTFVRHFFPMAFVVSQPAEVRKVVFTGSTAIGSKATAVGSTGPVSFFVGMKGGREKIYIQIGAEGMEDLACPDNPIGSMYGIFTYI